jgi:hypothetical protein
LIRWCDGLLAIEIPTMKLKIIGSLCYGAAAIATANCLDYDLANYGSKLLIEVALAGSIAFGLGCLVLPLRPRYGIMSGFLGMFLCWPYFGILAAFLPWMNFWWIIRVAYHGLASITALAFLFAATIYSIVEWRQLRLSR